MKTSTPKTLLTALAAGSLFFSGCFRDESPTGGGNRNGMSATFEGRVQGDAAAGLGKRSSLDGGVEGAIVTVARINSDGSLETVSTAEAKADVQGRFSVKAAADGARELVVVARKNGREWKAVVSAKAEEGRTIACRPLNIESSIEADVLAKVRGAGASEVSFADIASRVDAEVAMQVEAHAETGADAKADAEAWLSAGLRAECKARTEALVSSAGGFTLAQIDKANEARMDAEARLEADLEAAADLSIHGTITADAAAKIDSNRRSAEIKAWTEAGIVLGEVAKACDSSYRSSVDAVSEASVSAGIKLAWIRRLALENAFLLESSIKEEVKASDGRTDSAMARLLAAMEIAARAKAEFLAEAGADIGASAEGQARSLQIYAQTLARFTIGVSTEARFSLVKSAHAQACIALRAAAEAQVKAAGAAQITVQSLTIAGAALQASLEASADEEAIAKAYADYHAAVNVCLKQAVMLYASVVDSVDAGIRGADGARAELMGDLKAAADAEAVSKAHLEFSAQVEAQVQAAFGTGLGAPSAAQVKAVSQAMVLAGMCG
jgi:hypothetical protein